MGKIRTYMKALLLLLLERIFGPELTTGALVLYGVVSGAAGAALGLCGLKLLQGAVLQKNAEATE